MIEGLENGHVAILCKVHHSTVDGASGAGLLVHLFDLQRQVSSPHPRARRLRRTCRLTEIWCATRFFPG